MSRRARLGAGGPHRGGLSPRLLEGEQGRHHGARATALPLPRATQDRGRAALWDERETSPSPPQTPGFCIQTDTQSLQGERI